MDDIILVILQILTLSAIGSIYIFKDYLFSYSKWKAKNLATKEDISEITEKIQEVKHDYAKQLETTKADLSSQINNSSFRYEKEYEIISDITQKLVALRDCACSFRPIFDHIDPTKPEEERKKERLDAFHKSLRELYLVRENKRPFYTEDIYQAVKAVEDVAHLESIQYMYSDIYPENRTQDYWETAEKNQKEIVANADIALEMIRERVIKWEAIAK